MIRTLALVSLTALAMACTPAPTAPKAEAPPAAPPVAEATAAKPAVTDAMAIATAEGVRVSAGYMTVSNPGATDDKIVSASSPAAGKTELHLMEKDAAGVMKMRMAEAGVAVPAGGAVTFAPGGTHLMFLELPAPLKDGATIPVTLTFEKAGPVEVQFAVKPRSAIAKPEGHGGH